MAAMSACSCSCITNLCYYSLITTLYNLKQVLISNLEHFLGLIELERIRMRRIENSLHLKQNFDVRTTIELNGCTTDKKKTYLLHKRFSVEQFNIIRGSSPTNTTVLLCWWWYKFSSWLMNSWSSPSTTMDLASSVATE